MIKYGSAVTIARPPAEIFDYLVDIKKQAQWSDVQMRQITPGKLAQGSRLEVSFGMGPLEAVLGLEITDIVDGERMGFDTYSGRSNGRVPTRSGQQTAARRSARRASLRSPACGA